VDQRYEKDRYDTLLQLIEKNKLKNYELFSNTWSCDITPDLRNKICASDEAMRYQGRNMVERPLSNAEVSLFLNHIECLKKIRKEYSDGNFIIFESDIILYDNFQNNLNRVIELSKSIDWDIINIGNGNCRDKPKSEPIRQGLHLYKEKINRFAEGIIWNYKSICKFLEYFEKTGQVDAPFDVKLDYYSHLNIFNIYWAEPALVWQGSANNVVKSHLAI
jgi:GR25 family glycosyltransferase involved in LPS biosynthesis